VVEPTTEKINLATKEIFCTTGGTLHSMGTPLTGVGNLVWLYQVDHKLSQIPLVGSGGTDCRKN
jgi:hypothetical protein